jgi:ADP-ribosylglycohydrolase
VWQLTHSENSSVRKAAADTADVLQALFAGDAYLPRFLETMKKAVELADNGLTDLENIHALGEGWVGDEALFIGLYCAVRYSEDIDSALIAAVNHRGDSDSTGAVAGNIVGAHLGMSGIPEKYTKDLELTDEILTLADDLLRYDHDAQMNEAVKSDPEWVRKYCVSEI